MARLDERVRAVDARLARVEASLLAMDARTAAGFTRIEERLDNAAWVSQQQFSATLRAYVTQRSMAMWLLGVLGAMFGGLWLALVSFGGSIISWLRSP